ncbi:ParB/RepB/Spo0J family partition protein [Streptomyces alboflavus]|uniref:ParB/RepB/Spo0J family partition protein n=1 Tax=Streptomyces alboflavus TaxID=67267 RepID=UPI000F6574BF|nr:ParB/RepB/Spo0J family partition protein [Streptomyces alboflavus]
MSRTTTPAVSANTWPTLPVADLLAHAPVTAADADPALTESIQTDGITDPLYVATLDDADDNESYRVVDGLRRLAAAAAAALDAVPVTHRPVIRVEALTAHPGNVRADLRISKALRASVRENGVRIPIKVTRAAEGLRVVDGHRRLAAARAEKLTHIPYEYDRTDEAGQYLDMVTTAVHREALSPAEQASALFSAAELGASTKQLAAASGRAQKDVKVMVKAGKSQTAVRVSAHADLDLEDLAALAALEDLSPEAAARVEAAAKDNPGNIGYRIRTETHRAEAHQSARAHRARLEKDGARIRDRAELSDNAAPLYRLPVQNHDTCQGDAWVLDEPDDDEYTRYCTNAVTFGHVTTKPSKQAAEQERQARRAIIEGGRHWGAAQETRRAWLTRTITAKPSKAQADAILSTVTMATIVRPDVIAARIFAFKHTETAGALLGLPEERRRDTDAVARIAERAAAHRRPGIQLALIAACFELYMPRTTWRTDIHGEEGLDLRAKRHRARYYLTALQELGYQPTPIEAAVIADQPYDPTAENRPAQNPDAEDTEDADEE